MHPVYVLASTWGYILIYWGSKYEASRGPQDIMANSTDPLLPDEPTGFTPDSYVLPKSSGSIAPLSAGTERNAAADVIRQKIEQIYAAEEPAATEELAEAEVITPRSKHQQFMHDLASSGKSLADIQTAWHNYYISLSDAEKHQVWQEFYAGNGPSQPQLQPQTLPAVRNTIPLAPRQATTASAHYRAAQKLPPTPKPKRTKPKHATSAAGQKLIKNIQTRRKLEAKHHLQSLVFGLSMGMLVIFIFLFGFFNEFIIAPLIQPSRHASATPLILSSDGVAPTPNPEVIIPKINVELPVDFSQTSTDENTIENALENGVVHYPTTAMPGQNGNTAFFGHSSNNIFNKGKYKFAFVLLHELVVGDTFYITNGGKVYVYKVISKTVVEPTDVGVLGPVPGQTATATLITCDPPGTSAHRLIVVGQQISPDAGGNAASTATAPATAGTASPASAKLPGNGPTLLSRMWHAIF
jgi:LPXTG-site transpeptidase (sortase) family protein